MLSFQTSKLLLFFGCLLLQKGDLKVHIADHDLAHFPKEHICSHFKESAEQQTSASQLIGSIAVLVTAGGALVEAVPGIEIKDLLSFS